MWRGVGAYGHASSNLSGNENDYRKLLLRDRVLEKRKKIKQLMIPLLL